MKIIVKLTKSDHQVEIIISSKLVQRKFIKKHKNNKDIKGRGINKIFKHSLNN